MEAIPSSINISLLYGRYRASLPPQSGSVPLEEFQQFFWALNVDDADYWIEQLGQPDGASQLHEALTLDIEGPIPELTGDLRARVDAWAKTSPAFRR